MNIFLCGQQYFGRLTLSMLLEEGYSVVGVSAPAPKGDKMDRLWGLADLKGIPLTVAGTLRADTLPDGVDLIVAAHSHDFIGRRTRDRSTLGPLATIPRYCPFTEAETLCAGQSAWGIGWRAVPCFG